MISPKEYFQIFLLRTIGNFLILSCFTLLLLLFTPAIASEAVYRLERATSRHYVFAPKTLPKATSPSLLGLSEQLPVSPLDTNFGIVILKFGANARVISDVDAANYHEYSQALKKGVSHAKGTVYPGQIGNSFLFAHSVGNLWEVGEKNGVFYLLKELVAGDEVDLFYQGKRYVYVVYDKKVVAPTDVQYLSSQANFPLLTLQTCWPPGTALKRLLVFSRLKSSS